MKILIIGGTRFLGRHLVEAGLARGHELTLFNRGKTGPTLFEGVEQLHGDRTTDLDLLNGRHWDAVIDTCGYVPRVVEASARKLASAVERYVFISTVSVYRDFTQPDMDENSPLGTLDDPTVETITNETYGPLKVLCERAVEEALPGRVLQVRPGIIVGPFDPSDRFTYWPHRVAQGGEVLAPGRPDNPLLYIDARDLTAWVIRMVEARQTGIYNTYGPDYPLTMADFLDECKAVTVSDARFTWVDEPTLKETGLFDHIPLWVSADDPETRGFNTISSAQAQAAGLTYRPLAQTIRDTLEWDRTRPPETTKWQEAGLNPQSEAETLKVWHAGKIN